MKRLCFFLLIFVFSLSLGILPALASNTSSEIEQLKEEVKRLLKRIEELEKKQAETEAKTVEVEKKTAEVEKKKLQAVPDSKEVEKEKKVGGLLEKIKFKGILRLRHDTLWREEEVEGKIKEYARHRERFRLILGLTTKPTKTTEVGVGFGSGEGYQNTLNQSYGDHARGKQFFIYEAYASWQPVNFFKITAGKQKNPLFTTPLLWDRDVNPEGYSQEFKFKLTDGTEIFATLGQWFIEELAIKWSDRDPILLLGQLGFTTKLSETTELKLTGTYYNFTNLDVMEWKEGVLKDPEEFLGYNYMYSQQMIFDRDKRLLNKFVCWELGAELKVNDLLPVPFSFFANYVKNRKADIDRLIRDGVNPGDSDPAKLRKYQGDDRDTGWLLGLSLGKKEKKGDWHIEYWYQVLEDYAFPALFVDSDFHGGGTNNKGHYIRGRYFITDHIEAGVEGYITKRHDERKDGKMDENRIRLDMVFTF